MTRKRSKLRLIFAGTPEVAGRGLKMLSAQHEIALVITAPDAPVGRHRELKESPVARVARELDLPILKTKRVGDEQLAAITAAEAELAVVIAFGALIRDPALSALPWWNLHFSLLPAWRGASPLQHSILHSTGTGVTVFQLDEGLDSGPLIATRALPDPETSYGEALSEFLDVGIELLLKALRDQPAAAAQQGEPTLAPKLTRNDARLDFGLSATQLERTVRAFNPEPMAWSEFAGVPTRIIRAKTAPERANTLLIGQVWAEDQHVYVSCGSGVLELIEVQPAGKRVMAAADWFRGQMGGSFA
jgi:methionyl-tRNA formyltransferase